jgi:hypothetical protein
MLFVLNYGVPDPAAHFFAALMAGLLSIPLAGRWLDERMPHPVAATPVVLGLVAAGTLWVAGAVTERGRLVAVDSAMRARWHAIPFERGIVLWADDYFVRLKGYQILDGEKPGLYVENPNLLTWEGPRREFRRRFGLDPLAGLDLRGLSDVALIPANIARQTSLPVVDFERFRP